MLIIQEWYKKEITIKGEYFHIKRESDTVRPSSCFFSFGESLKRVSAAHPEVGRISEAVNLLRPHRPAIQTLC
jgi:hypothetical protein